MLSKATTCQLVAKQHPFRGEVLTCELPVGTRLSDVLDPEGQYFMEVDGKRVANPHAVVVSEDHRKIVVVGRPGTGVETGVAVATFFLGAAAAGTTAFVVITYAVVALSYIAVIAALVMVATLDIPKAPSTGPTQKLNSLTGSGNKFNPYGPLPVIYGQRRMFPALAAPAYTELLGKDQYLNMLFLVSIGEVVVTNPKLGDSSLTSYENVELKVHYPTPPVWFDISDNVVGVDLIESCFEPNAASGHTTTSSPNAEFMAVDMLCPGGLMHTPNHSDRTSARMYVRIEYKFTTSPDVPASWISVRSRTWENSTAGDGLVLGTHATTTNPSYNSNTGEIWVPNSNTLILPGSNTWKQVTELPTHSLDSAYYEVKLDGIIQVDRAHHPVLRKESSNLLADAIPIVTGKIVNQTVSFAGGSNQITLSSNPFVTGEYINISGAVAVASNAGNCKIVGVSGNILTVDKVLTTSANDAGVIIRRNNNQNYTRFLVLKTAYDAMGITLNSTSVTVEHSTANDLMIWEQTRNPFRIGIKWSVATAGQYDVRVTRTWLGKNVGNGVSAQDRSTSELPGLLEEFGKYNQGITLGILRTYTSRQAVDIPTSLPATWLSLRIRSNDQINGTLDNLSIFASRKLPILQSNLTFSGNTETRSPAAAALDVLLNPAVNQRAIFDPADPQNRNTATALALQAEQIDKQSFYLWETTGTINVEGFTYDEVIDYEGSVLDALRRIAGVAWAAIAISDGRYNVLQESPSPTRMLFTPKSTWDFSSSKTLFDIPHAIRVEFDSQDAENEQDEIIVYDDGYNKTGTNGTATGKTLSNSPAIGVTTLNVTGGSGTFNPYDLFTIQGESTPYTVLSTGSGTVLIGSPGLRVAHTAGQTVTIQAGKAASRFETVRLPGLVVYGNAWKHGRRLLAMGKLRPEVYTFSTGLESMIVQRGDVADLQQDAALLGLGSGRIISKVVSGGGFAITLDEPIQCQTGLTYALTCRATQTTLIIEELAATPTYANALNTMWTVSSAASNWQVGDLVSVGETSLVTRRVKILSVTPNKDLTATLTAVDEALGVYSAHTGDIPAYTSGITQPPDPLRISPAAPVIRKVTTSPNQSDNIVGGGKLYYASIGYDRGSSYELFTQMWAIVRYRAVDNASNLYGGWTSTPRIEATGTYNLPVDLNVTYDFQVQLVPKNGAPPSLWSNTFNYTVTVGTVLLEPVSALTVTGAAGGFNLTIDITAMVSSGVDHFEVAWSTTNSFSGGVQTFFVSSPGDLSGYTLITAFMTDQTESTRFFWVRWADIYGNASDYLPNPAVINTTTITATALAVGGSGSPGINTATISAYYRSTGIPSGGNTNPGAITYTFATPTSWTPGNGWSQSIPSGTLPIWVVSVTAANTTATDSVSAGEWTTAVQLTEGGAGANGLNNAAVLMYQRTSTSSPPALVSSKIITGNVTYDFTTGGATFAGTANGWTRAVPAYTAGYFWLWVTQATASNTTPTDVIPDTEWATAVLVVKDGTDGAAGAAGATGSPGSQTVGIKADSRLFSTAGTGYIYVHGFTAGAAADVDGAIVHNGNAGVSIQRGTLKAVCNGGVGTANQAALRDGYVAYDTLAATFTGNMSADGVSNFRLALIRRTRSGFQYDANGTWTTFTPTIGIVAIGTYSCAGGGTTITGAATFGNAMALTSLPMESSELVLPGDIGAAAITSIAAFAAGIRPITVSATPPGSPSIGDLYYDTDDLKVYRYNGVGPGWVASIASIDVVGNIPGTQITDGSITTPKFTANSIDASILTAGTVAADRIAANSLTAGQIAAGAIGVSELSANAVTADKLAATIVLASTIATAAGTARRAVLDNTSLPFWVGSGAKSASTGVLYYDDVANRLVVKGSLEASYFTVSSGQASSIISSSGYSIAASAVKSTSDMQTSATSTTPNYGVITSPGAFNTLIGPDVPISVSTDRRLPSTYHPFVLVLDFDWSLTGSSACTFTLQYSFDGSTWTNVPGIGNIATGVRRWSYPLQSGRVWGSADQLQFRVKAVRDSGTGTVQLTASGTIFLSNLTVCTNGTGLP